MKGYIINIDKNSKLMICSFFIFIIGLLIILNNSFSVSVPAISDDDSDYTFSQLDAILNQDKYLSYVNVLRETIFAALAMGKNEIIPLFAVYGHILVFKIYNDSVFDIQFRAPPFVDIGSFG